MSTKVKTILWPCLRAVVCVVAMCWVLSKVHWHDWATLADGQTQVRILNWQQIKDDLDDPQSAPQVVIRVEPHGQAPADTVRLGDLARTPDGHPDIQIGLKTTWDNCDSRLIALALLIFAPVAVLQSIRFTWMMRAQEINLSYWEGIKLSYAGNFLNFVALGSTGGDIYKAYYVSTHTHHKTEAVTTVFLDRAIGLISLLLIAATAMLLKFDDPKIRIYGATIGTLMAGLALGCVLVFSGRVRALLHVDALLSKLPFASQVQRIDATTRRMRQHKKLLTLALLITLLLQGLAVTAITVAGMGLGMNDDPGLYAGYFVYISLALLIAAIPITYQGGGTVDGALQIFFGGVYGNYSQILFLGFAMRILQLFWSLPGILVPIMGAHRPSMEKIAQLQSLTRPSES